MVGIFLGASTVFSSLSPAQTQQKPPTQDLKEKKEEKKGEKPGEKRPRDPVAVRTIRAQRTSRAIEATSLGTLQGQKQVTIYSKVTGRITFLGPPEGSAIRQGSVLVRVDRSDPGDPFVPTPITSPIEGWVGQWYVTSLGTQVTSQDPLVTVVDDTVLRVKVPLPIPQWLQVTPQTEVGIRAVDDPHAKSSGGQKARIAAIARIGDKLTSRGTVTLEVDNPDHLLKAGMLVRASFQLSPTMRLVIPSSALSLTDQGNYVFVLGEGERTQKKAVTFRPLNHDEVEILSGVDEGQEIITEGVHLVGDGIRVRVVQLQEPK